MRQTSIWTLSAAVLIIGGSVSAPGLTAHDNGDTISARSLWADEGTGYQWHYVECALDEGKCYQAGHYMRCRANTAYGGPHTTYSNAVPGGGAYGIECSTDAFNLNCPEGVNTNSASLNTQVMSGPPHYHSGLDAPGIVQLSCEEGGLN